MSSLKRLGYRTEDISLKLKKRSLQLQRSQVKPQHIRLIIKQDAHVFELPLAKPISIGRADHAEAQAVTVDLSVVNAAEYGISRLHAKILRKDGRVFIFDMGSLNGTWLNDRKLAAFIPASLQSGDWLMLGKLLIQVMLPEG